MNSGDNMDIVSNSTPRRGYRNEQHASSDIEDASWTPILFTKHGDVPSSYMSPIAVSDFIIITSSFGLSSIFRRLLNEELDCY
ncbi:hypothetical protein Tco_1225172, partial [Tanacetum coccineum]